MYRIAASAVEQAKRDFRRSGVLPDLQGVGDVTGLSHALRNAWAQGGRPESRTMELSSRWLPRSTANAITRGRVPLETLEARYDTLYTYLVVYLEETSPGRWLPLTSRGSSGTRPGAHEARSAYLPIPLTRRAGSCFSTPARRLVDHLEDALVALPAARDLRTCPERPLAIAVVAPDVARGVP